MRNSPNKTTRPRRRWWQKLCRLAVLLAMLGGAAYVALPWLLPSEMIARMLAEDMSRQMGVPVRIGGISFSWREGTEIRDLTIGSPPGFGPQPMVVVERIRSEFSPVNLLVHKRLTWMALDRPRLFVRVDKDGRTNLDPLRKLRFDVEADCKTVHQARATVMLPGHDRPLQLDVGDMQILTGRLDRVGRVTMSASLAQSGGAAPVSLYAGPGGEAVAGTVSFTFDNVDLGQLNLPQLMNLPLRSFEGRCSGSLDLQVDKELRADRVSLNVLIRDLDAQPTKGPKLPVIAEAGLRVSAAYDPLAPEGEVVDLQSVHLRLPGADLSGRALIVGNLWTAGFESIRSLELQGAVQPAQVVGLLPGGPKLPADLDVDGVVRVAATLDHEGPRMNFDLTLDAAEADIRRVDKPVKPRGREMRIDLAGRLDERTWNVDVRTNRVQIGANHFIGQGRVTDLRRAGRLWDAEQPAAFRETLAKLPPLTWQGSWVIRDVACLRDVWPPLADALSEVKLRGPVTGGWVLDHDEATTVQVSLTVPSQTHLAVGSGFLKPADTPMSLSLAGTLDPARPGVGGIDLSLSTGGGNLGVREGYVRAGDGGLDVRGRLSATRIEALLACLPHAGEAAALQGHGDAAFELRLDEPRRGATLAADLSDLDVTWAPEAGKTAGPWRRGLAGHLRGRGRLTAHITDTPEAISGELSLSGDDLAYAATGDIRRVKSAGVPLRLAMAGRIGRVDGQARRLDVRRATLDVGDSRLSLNGRADLDTPGKAAGAWPGSGLEAFDVDADIHGVLDGPLRQFLPELDEWIDRYDLAGRADVVVHVSADAKSASLSGTVDADRLSAGKLGPFSLTAPGSAEGDAPVVLGPLRKPDGMVARVKLDATAPADLSAVTIRDLQVRLDDVSLHARADLAAEKGGFKPRSVHATIWTKRTENLSRLVPQWKRHALSGGASVEAEWATGPDGGIPYVKLAMDDFRGRCRGRDIQAGGKVTLQQIRQVRDGAWEVGGFETDGLELRIGDNHGWLIADLEGLPAAPKGDIQLLCETADLRDLTAWWESGDTWREPADKKLGKVTPEQREAIAVRADALIAQARPYLQSAGLNARAVFENLTYYDPTVGQSYLLRDLKADVAVDNGHVDIEYVTGLYGGELRTQIDVRGFDKTPMYTQQQDLRDVIATAEMQPQLARYFPGNTVLGYFNREEKTTQPLRDVVANLLDPRYVLRPEGTTKTITLDGIVEGRAVPKFVTRLLPGLDLSTYPYRKMTAFATLRPDGTAVNDMVFEGQAYDVYMEGTTDADNIAYYEIGVILLNSPQSAEFNHLYRQGRIPVLKVKARIENGKMHDQEVTYPLPTETAYVVFVRNNVFYRIWLANRKKQGG